MTWTLFPQVQSRPAWPQAVTSQRWHHQVEQLAGVVLCCSNCMFLCSRLSLSLSISLFLLMSPSPPPLPSHSFLLPLWVCFPPSGVQMTIPVIAVKPPLWPVSTVCPFLLPVCLSICLLRRCMLAMMCVHVHVCLCLSIQRFYVGLLCRNAWMWTDLVCIDILYIKKKKFTEG